MTSTTTKSGSMLEAIEAYWSSKQVYTRNEARGLFLLGALVARVGSAQYKKGLKGDPILKKINFGGMPRDRVIILFNAVIGKLVDYKVHGFTMDVQAKAQECLDSVPAGEWALSPAENVFYIMSGYAFNKQYSKQFAKEGDEPEGEETGETGELEDEEVFDEEMNEEDEE